MLVLFHLHLLPIIINERFSRGDYDVYVNLKTNSGKYWDFFHQSEAYRYTGLAG